MTSEELNNLIYKYLKEEGLQLSAAALDKETNTSQFVEANKPPNNLIDLVLKGLKLSAIEEHVFNEQKASKLPIPHIPLPKLVNCYLVNKDFPIKGGIDVLATEYLFVSCLENVGCFDLNLKKQTQFESGGDKPTSLAQISDSHIVCGYLSGAIRVWSNSLDPELDLILMPPTKPSQITLLKASNNLVASVDLNNNVRVYDITDQQLKIDLHFSKVLDIKFNNADLFILTPEGVYNQLNELVNETKNACIFSLNPLKVGTETGYFGNVKRHNGQITFVHNNITGGVDGKLIGERELDLKSAILFGDAGEFLAIVTIDEVVLVSMDLTVLGRIQQSNVSCCRVWGDAVVVSTLGVTRVYRTLHTARE